MNESRARPLSLTSLPRHQLRNPYQDEQLSNGQEPIRGLKLLGTRRLGGGHGFESFDPIVGSEGKAEFPKKVGPGTEDDLRTAFDACHPLLEGTVFGASKTDADIVKAADSLLELAQCMRAAGFDMRDPDASGQFPEIGEESPESDAAYERCANEFGTNGGSK